MRLNGLRGLGVLCALALSGPAFAQIISCPVTWYDPPTPCKGKCCGGGPGGPGSPPAPPPGAPPASSGGGGSSPSGPPGSKNSFGNSFKIGEPISSLSQAAYHRTMDLDVEVPFGSIWLTRDYRSDEESFSSNNGGPYNCLRNVPVPFGRVGPEDSAHGTHVSPAMHWTHNLFSHVCSISGLYVSPGGKPPFAATDIWGERLRFDSCQTPPCVGRAIPSGELQKTSRFLKMDAGWQAIDETGMRVFYEHRYVSDAGNYLYFLSSVVDPEGRTVGQATYENPLRPDGGPCTEGVTGSVSGVPYLKKFVSPATGAGLSFAWTELPRFGLSGARDCVLSQVRVLRANGTLGPVVSYGYRGNMTGYLEFVDGGIAPESYDYDGGFGIKQADSYVSFHPLDFVAANGQATGARVAGPAFDISWVEGDGGVACAANTCCASGVSYRNFRRTATYTNVNSGDFSGGSPGFARTFVHGRVGQQYYQYPLLAMTDSCAAANSCSAGTEYYGWRTADAGVFCTIDYPGREVGFRNKLGAWFLDGVATVYADAGPWNGPNGVVDYMWERRAALRGVAPDITSNNPLEISYSSFGYTSDVSAQLLRSTERPSVVQAGANSGTYYRYTPGTAHLEAVYRSGYTKDTDGNVQPRTIATFYRTVRPSDMSTETLGRVVAIEGPCDVDAGTSSTACTSTPAPLTELIYYEPTTGDDNAGRLKEVHQYPAGSSSTPLITQYLFYTPAGDPTLVIPPNSVVPTAYAYNEAREVTMKTEGLGYAYFTWENGKLVSIQHPEGNFDRFCYRAGSDCSGAWMRNLQWQAKTGAFPWIFSEKIVYDYWPNDSLKSKTYYTDGPGGAELRRQEWFDEDAHQRPTAHRIGDGTGSFTSKKAWDGANNLAAIGPSFNGAPDFCKTGSALDDRCAWLKYDRANRFSELDAHPAGAAGPGLRTCFDHDAQGNVRRISTGCLTDAGTACNTEGGLSTCSAAPNDYTYDDLGNVVEAKLANSDDGTGAPGWIRYLHDAFGNVTYERRSSGLTNTFTYDQLGRLLTVTSNPYEAFTLTYDDASVVPGSCGTVANTLGRLVMRTDAYWKTYYSYDAEGRVVREARHSAGSSGCPTPALDTIYTYSANGNLTSIRYPHGRTVTYSYSGSAAAVDRVSSISMTTHNGTSFSSAPGTTIIDEIAWEPYGGLRSYVAHHATSSSGSRVEYMLGGDSSASPGSGLECADSAPSITSGYDRTGRLRSLRVSFDSTSSLGTGSGELFKRLYTWKADQVTRMDTCYLDDDLPLTENIGSTGYDGTWIAALAGHTIAAARISA